MTITWVRWGVLVAAVGGVLYLLTTPAVEQAVARAALLVSGSGVLGLAGFSLLYVVATVAMLPGTILGLLAGFLFGPVIGVLVVSPASVLGATGSFVLAKTLLRRRAEKAMGRIPRFEAIDKAVAEDGFRVTFLLRLSPLVPFNLLNYALGLTGIRVSSYVVASWVGMLPGTAAIVYLGSLIATTEEVLSGTRPDSGSLGTILTVAGAAATVLVVIMISRLARRRLETILTGTA